MAKLSILLALGLILLWGQYVHCHESGSDHESAEESAAESTHESSEAQEEGSHRIGIPEDQMMMMVTVPDDMQELADSFFARYSFPDVVGKTGEEARDAILAEHPTFDVPIVDENSALTMDWRSNRVRVFVDAEGKVVDTPVNG